jgi:hypothetical protein
MDGVTLGIAVLVEVGILAVAARWRPKPTFHQLMRWDGQGLARYEAKRDAIIEQCEHARDDYTRRYEAGSRT